MNKLNKAFMAFAVGKESTEGASIKRYIGVGSMFIVGVNPNKAELSAIYGTDIENEPEYIGVAEVGPEGDKKKVAQLRIDFILKSDPSTCNGIEMITKAAFFLKQASRVNGDGTKTQVIDKYGRSAWVTSEELKGKLIPQYRNGPANIDPDYRPAYIGEVELTEFMKVYLGIPNPMNYVNGSWVDKSPSEKADAEARFEGFDSYFKGNVTEIKRIVAYQPKNKIKVALGIKTTPENKQYQSVYTQMVLRNNTKDYSRLAQDIQNRKDAGAFADTEFDTCELKEYVLEATDFSSTDELADDPFAPVR